MKEQANVVNFLFSFSLIFLLMLPNCGGSKQSKRAEPSALMIDEKKVAHIRQLEQIRFFEGRLIDIPIPAGSIPIPHLCVLPDEGHSLTDVSLGYSTHLSAEQLVAFFQEQMEWLGWHKLYSCGAAQYVLLFEKPRKMCTITVQKGADFTRVEPALGEGDVIFVLVMQERL